MKMAGGFWGGDMAASVEGLAISEALVSDGDGMGAIEDVLFNQALYREPLLMALRFCFDECERADVEERLDSFLKGIDATRPASSLIESLLATGGLSETIVADGVRMTRSEYEALHADAEDGGCEQVFVLLRTTQDGRCVAGKYSTSNRLVGLFVEHPELSGVYSAVLDFCNEPKSYREIEIYLGTSFSAFVAGKGERPLVHPSFVLEGLQLTGSLSWAGGWKTTEEGRAAVASLARK